MSLSLFNQNTAVLQVYTPDDFVYALFSPEKG